MTLESKVWLPVLASLLLLPFAGPAAAQSGEEKTSGT